MAEFMGQETVGIRHHGEPLLSNRTFWLARTVPRRPRYMKLVPVRVAEGTGPGGRQMACASGIMMGVQLSSQKADVCLDGKAGEAGRHVAKEIGIRAPTPAFGPHEHPLVSICNLSCQYIDACTQAWGNAASATPSVPEWGPADRSSPDEDKRGYEA